MTGEAKTATRVFEALVADPEIAVVLQIAVSHVLAGSWLRMLPATNTAMAGFRGTTYWSCPSPASSSAAFGLGHDHYTVDDVRDISTTEAVERACAIMAARVRAQLHEVVHSRTDRGG